MSSTRKTPRASGPSLATKLTLAFVGVALVGAALLAVFVGVATNRAFDRFVVDTARDAAVEAVAEFYAANGSWSGIEDFVPSPARPSGMPRSAPSPGAPAPDHALEDGMRPEEPGSGFVLLDETGRVLLGDREARQGQVVSTERLAESAPILIDGRTVGYVLSRRPGAPRPGEPAPPEVAFRDRVTRAIGISAIAAVAIAVALGWVLSRAIVKPVRDLTEAMGAVAEGDLGLQLAERGNDEIAELTHSFNQMSSQLESGRRLRRQMTADIAHDLRTPLTVIAGYTEGLVDGRFDGSLETYQTLRDEAVHLQRLVEDLRTLSLADAGELTLERAPVEPSTLLRGVASRFAPEAEDRGVRVEVDVRPDVRAVDVDAERMAQVLANLVANALRHASVGGTVALRAEGASGGVALVVQDDGEGIAPEHLPYVFGRHYRADRIRSAGEGASGLGLAIAKSLVEAHGGTIGLESTVGLGTTVTVVLPAASA